MLKTKEDRKIEFEEIELFILNLSDENKRCAIAAAEALVFAQKSKNTAAAGTGPEKGN